MPTYEHAALLQHKDQNGDMHIDYPITKAENVDGLSETIQTEISDLKKSVSDGKTAVANAITAKGITTATDATFSVMAENIEKITSGESEQSGIGLNIFTQPTEPDNKDGVWVKTNNAYERIIIDNHILNEGGVWGDILSNIPISTDGAAVVYNGEINILSRYTNHYKWNGSTWTKVSTLPFNIEYARGVVVYNNEIHILGKYGEIANGDTNYKGRAKWNGSSWSGVAGAPMHCQICATVVYNNELHMMGGGSYIYNNAWYENYNAHYKWNGTSYTKVETLPYNIDGWGSKKALVYKGEIHNFSGKTHYKWDGVSWTSIDTVPTDAFTSIVYNGEIHIIGFGKQHYKWDESTWTNVSTVPVNGKYTIAVTKDNYIFAACGSKYAFFTTPENLFDPHTLILQKGPTINGTYNTAFADMSFITGDNNRFPSGFDDVWYFDDTSFDMNAEIYYGDGTQWIKIKN